jgi:phosphoribosylanthranilate isomerase
MRIKICCIQSEAEARMAIAAGADALGLVAQMPSGPGVIDESTIAAIAARVPPPIATFLLTCEVDAPALIEQARRCGCGVLQLCDLPEPEVYPELRAALPRVRLVQVIHVRGPESVEEALAAAPRVDALLLDSGNPLLQVKELGGTGRTHDWAVSRAIRERASVPVFLAGGLNASNVAQAVEAVEPFGLDLCSGVRSNGRLDPQKLAAFMKAARPQRCGG